MTPPADRPGRGRAGGSFGRTVLTGLAAAGLAAVAATSVWAVQDTTGPARPVGAPLELAGSDLVPLAVPLTLVALASWGAVLVLRRRGRRVVAVVGAVAALTAAVVTVRRVLGADDVDPTAWPWVTAAAATVTGLTLVRAWVAAPGWPEMSSRYDRQGAGAAAGPAPQQSEQAQQAQHAGPPGAADLWRALDEGRDPTADPRMDLDDTAPTEETT